MIEDPSEQSLGLGWEVAALAVMLIVGAAAAVFVTAVIAGGVEPVAYAAVAIEAPPPLDATRLLVGVGGAVGTAALAGWLIRTTDWQTRPHQGLQAAEESPHLLGGP